MKAILIDPITRTVTQVEREVPGLAPVYRFTDCDCVAATPLRMESDRGATPDVVYVDDEGLLKDPRYFFKLSEYPDPLAGKGLVVGTTEEGDDAAPKTTVEAVRAMVTFYELL